MTDLNRLNDKGSNDSINLRTGKRLNLFTHFSNNEKDKNNTTVKQAETEIEQQISVFKSRL